MLRHIIAILIGWLVTFLFLVVWNQTKFTEPMMAFAIAALIGSVGGWFWPAVVGFFLVRRAKNRRDEKIQQEVDRQVAEKTKQG